MKAMSDMRAFPFQCFLCLQHMPERNADKQFIVGYY